MASEKRCHYEVLGLSRDCSPDEIRTAYRKLALQRHPDKLVKSGVSEAEATAQFQELVHAYEVISDPKERAWYDSHRSQILFSDVGTSVSNSSIPNLFSFFSNTVFNGYSDSGKGFYKVYSDVFDNVYGNEISYARKLGLSLDLIREAPLMGNLESPYAQVTAFYNYWLGFCTVMDFGWVDMYDAAAGVNRKSRRVMEEDNKKLRKKAKREYNDTVRGLAEFVKKRDKRVIDMLMKKNLENEKRREEEKERKKKLEKERLERAKAYEEPEWAKINEEIVLEEISPDEDGEVKEDKELYCVVCSKKFKSEKQWQNHEKSKKHKEKVAALKDSFLEEDELINGGESDGVEEVEEKIDEVPGIEEDELVIADESYGVEEIEERIKEDLGIKEDEVVSEDDDYKEPVSERNSGDGNGSSEEDKFFDVDETKSNGEYAVKDDVGSSGAAGRDGDDVNVDDISVLEAMLSGRKNRKKAAVEEKPEFMEYDNRKVTRKTRRKDKSKKNKAESVDADEENSINHSDEANGFAKSSNEASGSNSLSMSEHKSMEDNDVVVNHRKEKGMGKKEANAKLKNMPKGKKGKASSKNMDDYSCETCGEEFESRNKLHKHLGETGHAATKFRR